MASLIKSRRFWTVTVSLAVVVGLFALLVVSRSRANAEAQNGSKVAELRFSSADLTSVKPAVLAQSLSINGNLDARSQAVVKAKQAVDVLSISVREGDAVQAGQRLAQLDTADLKARLAEKVSSRDSAKAQFDLAEKNRETNRTLLEKHFISQNAFDSTDSTFKANRASLEAADSEVQLAQIALSQTVVNAPITGIVAKRYLKVGEKASIDAPLFTIVDLDSLELEALIPASEVASLRRGQSAQLAVDGFPGRSFAATLDRISPATEPGTRSILVFFTVRNPDHVLKSGMFAEGVLDLGKSGPVPTLPLTAIQSDGGQSVVWSIESNAVTRHPVQLGRRDPAAGLVEIKDGLSANVPVLATKFDNLREGQPAVIASPGVTQSSPKPDRPS
jgi:RND family efflux transporter MFP subunit